MNGQAQHKPLPRFNYRLETANDPGNGTASVFAQTSFDIIALNGKPVFSWGNVEPKGKRFKTIKLQRQRLTWLSALREMLLAGGTDKELNLDCGGDR